MNAEPRRKAENLWVSDSAWQSGRAIQAEQTGHPGRDHPARRRSDSASRPQAGLAGAIAADPSPGPKTDSARRARLGRLGRNGPGAGGFGTGGLAAAQVVASSASASPSASPRPTRGWALEREVKREAETAIGETATQELREIGLESTRENGGVRRQGGSPFINGPHLIGPSPSLDGPAPTSSTATSAVTRKRNRPVRRTSPHHAGHKAVGRRSFLNGGTLRGIPGRRSEHLLLRELTWT